MLHLLYIILFLANTVHISQYLNGTCLYSDMNINYTELYWGVAVSLYMMFDFLNSRNMHI